MPTTPMRPRLHQIIRAVSDEFNVNPYDIVGPSRREAFVTPRHVACWIASRYGYTLPMIGMHIGGRDHTSVLHGVCQIDAALRADPALAVRLARIGAMAAVHTEAWLERTRTGKVLAGEICATPDGCHAVAIATPPEPEDPLPRPPSQINQDADYAAWMRSVVAHAHKPLAQAIRAEGAL